MTTSDVLTGDARWSVERADCLPWLQSLPEDSLDLVLCSPPYTLARTYAEGGDDPGIARKPDEWVAWMADVAKACVRACKGLCAFVVEGQTSQYRYDCTPFLLMAELHRAGLHLRKPCVYFRYGIPGSGGPDWWRNDWEPVVCVAKGRLPWADNVSCGHPPKYAPGGKMSNRRASGVRVGESSIQLPRLIEKYSRASSSSVREVLSGLQQAVDSQTVCQWLAGVTARLREASVLRQGLRGRGKGGEEQGSSPRRKREGTRSKNHDQDLLLPLREEALKTEHPSCGREPAEQRRGEPTGSLPVLPPEAAQKEDGLPNLWSDRHIQELVREALRQAEAARRSAHSQSQPASPADCGAVDLFGEAVTLTGSRDEWGTQGGSGMRRNNGKRRTHGRKVMTRPGPGQHSQESTAYYPPALANPGNVLRETYDAETVRQLLSQFATREVEHSDVIRCLAGGGHLGNKSAHSNEAPFPESLVTPFILSFCPPGGVVCDPFTGSGTTGAVALRHGRRFVGCDVRQSQVDLASKRLGAETPGLFDSPTVTED